MLSHYSVEYWLIFFLENWLIYNYLCILQRFLAIEANVNGFLKVNAIHPLINFLEIDYNLSSGLDKVTNTTDRGKNRFALHI